MHVLYHLNVITELVSAANDHDARNSSIAVKELGPSLESFHLVISLEANF